MMTAFGIWFNEETMIGLLSLQIIDYQACIWYTIYAESAGFDAIDYWGDGVSGSR